MQIVSVIIPVFNVEKYIDRCVQSIIEQTYSNWELILINDGSYDNSGDKCDTWSKLDKRIRVFHIPNGGVSNARNVGLNNAIGEWIMFVDSDDWLEKQCLEVCVSTAIRNNLDIVQFNYRIVDSKGVLRFVQKKETIVLTNIEYIENRLYNVCAGGSLIKRNLIDKNVVRFPYGVKLAEDQIFMMECMACANRIKFNLDSFYNYFLNENSAVHNAKTIDILHSIKHLEKFSVRYPIFRNHIVSQVNSFCGTLLCNGDCSLDYIIKKFDSNHYESKRNAVGLRMLLFSPNCIDVRVRFCIYGFLSRLKLKIRNFYISLVG